MCRHIRALKHLCKAAECADNVLNQLKGGCCALAEGLCKAAVWVARHASHSAVHSAHAHAHTSHAAVHATHTAHATVHGAVTTAHAGVGRAVAAHPPISAAVGGAVSVVHARVVGRVAVRDGAERVWHGWQRRRARGCGCRSGCCAAIRSSEACVVVSRDVPDVSDGWRTHQPRHSSRRCSSPKALAAMAQTCFCGCLLRAMCAVQRVTLQRRWRMSSANVKRLAIRGDRGCEFLRGNCAGRDWQSLKGRIRVDSGCTRAEIRGVD